MVAAGPTHIALLRGINVGKAKRVAMADLRASLEGAGFGGVRTLLQSGNVVLTGRGTIAALTARMEKAFLADVGFSSRFTVLAAADLAAILAANPFPDAVVEPARLFVGFLADASVVSSVAALADVDWGAERIALGARVLYAHCPLGQADSPLMLAIARSARDGITTRNWATLTKLQALIGSPQ